MVLISFENEKPPGDGGLSVEWSKILDKSSNFGYNYFIIVNPFCKL